MTQLTEHFTLAEFTTSQNAARMGIDNTPTGAQRENVERMAATMEKVRTLLGNKPIMISSGYRNPQVNAACGGSPTSSHMSGLACDFTCPSFGTPLKICQFLMPHMQELGIDQLIHEFDSWVHLGLSASAPRMMALTINNTGTHPGIA